MALPLPDRGSASSAPRSRPPGRTPRTAPAPCWVEISHDSTYLFIVNTGSGNISSYAIKRDGSLVLIGSFAIKGGGANIDARLSPDGKYLLVNGSGAQVVSVFAVNGGNLTEVSSSPTPLPAGATSSSGIVNT
jgi:6-phosphogluconolactonase (cycloisomerase 2 family)